MKLRQTNSVVAAKASLSTATGYRLANDGRLPSQNRHPRSRRRPPPPQECLAKVVLLLKATPGIRAIAIFEEMMRRYPEL